MKYRFVLLHERSRYVPPGMYWMYYSLRIIDATVRSANRLHGVERIEIQLLRVSVKLVNEDRRH